jgi:serine/threonine-protein kinase
VFPARKVGVVELCSLAFDENLAHKTEPEVAAMLALNHPNVLRLHAFSVRHHHVYLVVEATPAGSLDELLCQQGHRWNHADVMPLRSGVRVGREIASGMRYLCKKRIPHRALYASNVQLVYEHQQAVGAPRLPHPRLTGHGVFRLLRQLQQQHCAIGGAFDNSTPMYVPPELISGAFFTRTFADAFECGVAADVYAFGVLLWQLVTGERDPYR